MCNGKLWCRETSFHVVPHLWLRLLLCALYEVLLMLALLLLTQQSWYAHVHARQRPPHFFSKGDLWIVQYGAYITSANIYAGMFALHAHVHASHLVSLASSVQCLRSREITTHCHHMLRVRAMCINSACMRVKNNIGAWPQFLLLAVTKCKKLIFQQSHITKPYRLSVWIKHYTSLFV